METAFPDFTALVNRAAPFLLDAALRSLLVLALAAPTALALHRASAAARHWVWLLAFAGLLLLPALSATLPTWRVLPRIAAVQLAPAPAPSSPVPGIAPEPETTPPRVTRIDNPPANYIPETPAPALTDPGTPTALSPRPAVAPSAGTPMPPPLPPVAASPHPFPWTAFLMLAWCLGATAVAAHVLLGHLSLLLLRRRCTPLGEGDWPALLDQLRRKLAISRPVNLLSSPARTMPMTWGLWHSHLLLPAEATTWPAEQRRAVLLHELGHVRRHDCLTHLLAQIALAAYWFNPLAWFAWRNLQIERERACDDLVLAAGTRPSAYATHLLHTTSDLPPVRFVGVAALAIARPSRLEHRLRAILDPHRNRHPLTLRTAALTTLLLLAILVPVAILKAQDASATPATEPATAPATREALAMAAYKINITNNFGPGPRYAALADLIKPGMTLADLQTVLPPVAPPDGSVSTVNWNGNSWMTYPVEGGYAVEAQGTGARNATGQLDMILSHPPKILTPAEAAKLLAKAGPAATTPATRPAASLPETRPTASGPASRGRSGSPDRVQRIPAAAPGEGPTCILDATIYDVRVPADQIGRLDLVALTQAAATPAQFEKQLADFGPAQPLYRVNQSVRLGGDQLQIASQAPYVSNSQNTTTGTVNTVSYASVGLTFNLAGKIVAYPKIELDLNIGLSTLSPSATTLSTDIHPPMFRMTRMSHKGFIEARQPFVVASIDGSTVDADGKAIAYIARITLGEPRPAIAGTRGP